MSLYSKLGFSLSPKNLTTKILGPSDRLLTKICQNLQECKIFYNFLSNFGNVQDIFFQKFSKYLSIY